MYEGEFFSASSSGLAKRFLAISPILAMVVIILGFTWLAAPRDPLLRWFVPTVIIVISVEGALIWLWRVKGYRIIDGEVWTIMRMWNRRVRLPSSDSTLIVAGQSMGSRCVWVASRDRTVSFVEVDDQDRFVAELSAIIGDTSPARIPRHATYLGTTWTASVFAVFMIVVPTLFFVPAVFRYPEDTLAIFFFYALMTSPILLPGVLYALVGMNIRIVRNSTGVIQKNMFRRVVQRWTISEDVVVGGPTLWRSRFDSASGSFKIPLSFGFDRRLFYDVMAIASGRYEFLEA